MFEKSGHIYSNASVKLREVAARSKFKIEQTEQNQKKYVELEEQIDRCKVMVDSMNSVMSKVKPWISDLQEYNDIKKRDSLLAINSALSVANFVVPSSMKGIQFKIEGNEAWLENAFGTDADRSEGSGYKGAVSVYLRNIVLKANPNLLQFLYLDEPLSKLSTESSAVFSTYVPLLAENMQIVWIEHKGEVFSSVEDKVVYRFHKGDNGYVTVLKEV